MSNTTVRFLKAIAGLAIVVILMVTVMNWWGDYRKAATDLASKPTTATAEPSSEPATGQVTQGTAVVLIDGLNFRKAPDTSSVTIRGLKKGEKLMVVASKPDWYQVRDAKRTTGWIAAKSQYVRIEK